jgi:hypothetical protein
MCPHCGARNPADALFCESCGYDFTTGQAPEPIAPPVAPAVTPTNQPAISASWLIVVEVDSEWFSLKGELADQPCPPATTRTISLTSHTSLVGRSSQSKGVHPEIALDGDTGVSRRHAQFVVGDPSQVGTDTTPSLAIVDLSSTNGTYVVEAGQAPTTQTEPIASGVATVLQDGDRVYLGAWTRLTVRRSG